MDSPPPRNLGSDKSGCCLQCRILSHVTTRTRPELSTVIDLYLYLSCRFVCGCSCDEVDTVTVNLVLSISENELGYTPNSCHSKLYSVTLLVINMLGKMTQWSCLMPENTKCVPAVMQIVHLEVCWCFFFFRINDVI
jgi:hypothetical protein